MNREEILDIVDKENDPDYKLCPRCGRTYIKISKNCHGMLDRCEICSY